MDAPHADRQTGIASEQWLRRGNDGQCIAIACAPLALPVASSASQGVGTSLSDGRAPTNGSRSLPLLMSRRRRRRTASHRCPLPARVAGKKAGIELPALLEALKASAGNSYVLETEGPFILNGTFDTNCARRPSMPGARGEGMLSSHACSAQLQARALPDPSSRRLQCSLVATAARYRCDGCPPFGTGPLDRFWHALSTAFGMLSRPLLAMLSRPLLAMLSRPLLAMPSTAFGPAWPCMAL